MDLVTGASRAVVHYNNVVRACAQVFNDWLAEFCVYDPKRLQGVAMIPMGDPDWAVSELERIGVDRVLWESDFPHVRSIGLDAQNRPASMFKSLSPEDAKKVVSETVTTAFQM